MTPDSGSHPPRASSLRPLGKIFSDAVPVWFLTGDGRIAYASAACGRWLGVDPESLVGQSTVAEAHADASTASITALRRTALALAAPPECAHHQALRRRVYPPADPGASIDDGPSGRERDVLFVPISRPDEPAVVAIADVDLPSPSAESAEFRALIDAVHRQVSRSSDSRPPAVTLGATPWAARLIRQIELAAASDAAVTLSGPRGSGFEPLVRAIQSHTTTPLVTVDGSLMDAELFDAATGGVLARLLDDPTFTAAVLVHDVDQMAADAQERLEILARNHQPRLRLFMTTSRPTASLASVLTPWLAATAGVLEISVPPLAQRVDDIPVIAAALLQRRHHKRETRAVQISREALDRLVLYPWPGNFDELDGAIRSASRACGGDSVQPDHLPLAVRSYGRADAPPVTAPKPAASRPVPLDEALAAYERQCIVTALEAARGNRAAAARMLEISRPRLLRRIEQLDIAWPVA